MSALQPADPNVLNPPPQLVALAGCADVYGQQSNADCMSSDGSSGGEQAMDHQDGEVNQDANGRDSSSNGQNRKPTGGRGGAKPRKPHLQGRFSGRLETKMDEKRLMEECRLLGPLLGGVGKRGEKSRLTLAKIVRGIASGEIRAHCERREHELRQLRSVVESSDLGTELNGLRVENAELREQLARRDVETDNLVAQVHQANAAVAAAHQATTVQVVPAPPAPLLPTSMAPLAPVGGMVQATAVGVANGLSTMPIPSSLPVAVATSGALNIAAPASAMVQAPPPPVLQPAAQPPPVKPEVMSAPVPVPVQAASIMQQAGTSLMAAAAPATVQLVTGSAAGLPEAPAPVLLPPQVVSVQQQSGMVHSNSALQLAPTPAPPPQPSNLQTVTYAASMPQQTAVLENVINKQHLQIQASNLGQEAQAQRQQAQQHAAAQQEAQAAAQQAAVQAQAHAKLHAEATMQADSLKRVIQEVEDPGRAASTVQELEAKAAAHADASNQLGVHAQHMSERAHAHAQAQVQATTAAQNLSVQAQNLQAVAHQMESAAAAATATTYVVSQAAFTQPVLLDQQNQQVAAPQESNSFTLQPSAPSASRVTAVPSQATMVEQSMASSSSMPRSLDPSPVAEQQVLLVQPSSGAAQSMPATMTVMPIQQQQQLPHSGALSVEAVQQQQQQMAAMQQVMRTATLLPSQTTAAPVLQQVVAAPQQQVVNVIPTANGLQTVMATDALPAGSLQAVPVNLQTVSAGGVVTTQQVHLIQQSNTPPDLQQAVAPGQTVVVHTPPEVAQLSHTNGRQLSTTVSQKHIAMKQAAIQQHVAAAAQSAAAAVQAQSAVPPPPQQLTEHQLVVQQLNDSTMPLPPGATPDVLSVLDVSDLMQDADVGTPMPTVNASFSAPMTSLGLSGPL